MRGGPPSLRLIATTDLHAHLLPFDYYRARPEPATGLAQAASVIAALRAAAPGPSLLLDNGDSLTGSLLSDLLPGDWPGPHPVIAAMNALGYDAATLGNHEFDHGLGWLRRALADAGFPVVSANLRARDGAPLAEPWTILEREVVDAEGQRLPLRVGLLGLGPPQTAPWSGPDEPVEAADLVATAAAEIPRLRAAGADLVVALCHSGLGAGQPGPELENAALPLARLPGLDALILGHTHEVFPAPLRGRPAGVDPVAGTLASRPAVQAGFHGRHVGVIDLALAREDGRWRVAGHRAEARRVPADTPLDPGVAAIAAPAHRAVTAAAMRPLGLSRVALHSYFALVAPSASLDVVADAKRAEARRLLAGRPEADLPILATVSPLRAGGAGGPGNYLDLAPGGLEYRQAAELYVYPNTLVLLEVTGRMLRDWLDRAAAVFRHLVPGIARQPLLDPAVPSYHADTIDGLSWEVDPSLPPRTAPDGRLLDPGASRIGDLRHAGRRVAADDRFVLATSSYRLAGGGGFAPATGARVILRSPRPTRDVVLAHVAAHPVDPAPRPRWRFADLPGTSAWFDTGPAAAAHLDAVEGRRLVSLGPTEAGFWRADLRL